MTSARGAELLSTNSNGPQRNRALWRLFALGLGVALLLVLASRLPLLHALAIGATWARGAGLAGVLAGVAAIVGATLLLSPVIPLIILSGWVWGPWGGPISLAAATLSSVLSFSIARALGRTAFAELLKRSHRVAKVFAHAERGGPLTVALLRLAPIIPFTPGNATLGLTQLTVADIAIGTSLGLLPGAIFYIWMGVLLPDAASIERGDALHLLFARGWLLAALFAAHLIVVGFAAWLARKLHARPASQ